MFELLKRLFGAKAKGDVYANSKRIGLVPTRGSESNKSAASDSYFNTMGQMQEAISKRRFEDAAGLVRQNLRQLPGWVNEYRQEYGEFEIRTIPALQQGGTILALTADDEGLAEMQRLVVSTPDLQPWKDQVSRHAEDRHLLAAILEAIKTHPKCLQTDVKGHIGAKDGHRVANLISYLEKADKVVRIKAGKTHSLVLAGSSDAPVAPPKPAKVGSHRSDRRPTPILEIDIASLSYVPLPRSPLRWNEEQTDSGQVTISEPEMAFEVRDAPDWRIKSVEKISMSERPDPAFRKLHPNGSGLLMIDDLGKTDGLGAIEAAAFQYDRSGKAGPKVGFLHGIYRVGVHPLGLGLIAMSKECLLHAYDEQLESLFQTALAEAPEIKAIRKRLEIPNDKLKNHIRCVALSQDGSRYLFTVVDEAWCVDSQGKGLWGAKLPFTEGWTRIATPSGGIARSAEVEQALEIMSLSLPLTPEDLKRRYRQLAKEWHPDLNPNDPEAEEKTKSLTGAVAVLTGIDPDSVSDYTGATFAREEGRTEYEAGGTTFTVTINRLAGELQAADWIYAASFAGDSHSVYLAGYSGHVVVVDEDGQPVRVYDIGSVPRRIVDTGDYLYLLTDTRLYVLREDALHALIDTSEGGDVIVAQTGFGLLEKNRLRWFFENGTYLGSILSKDPIRRAYSTTDGMVIETRQRRALVKGAPGWWE